MSFLLDSDTCSAHLKARAGVLHRFVQHSGRLYIPTIVLGDLHTWAHRQEDPRKRLEAIAALLEDVEVLVFDARCAEVFGVTRGGLLRLGISVPSVDLMIASVALAHDLTLVTHNTADFANVPGLRLEDWLAP